MKRFVRMLLIFGFILCSPLFAFAQALDGADHPGAEPARSYEYIAAPEHSFTEQLENGQLESLVSSVIKTPTNTEDGAALVYCSDCTSFLEVPIPKLSAEEFIVVPYIESTGNEYLDSGLTMEREDTVIYDLDMQFIERRDNDLAGTNAFLQFSYDYLGHCDRTQLTIAYNQDGDFQEKIYDNGTLTKSLNWSHWTYQDSKIGFFCLGNYDNSWWSNAAYGQRARLYGATITQNGYVAGCYIPVINSKTGETGLYDVITERFIKNAGNGGNFILPEGYQSVLEKAPTNDQEGSIAISYPGQEEELHVPVPAIDRSRFLIIPYIESTGMEYIDTGLHLSYSDSASYSLDYQFLSDTASNWAGGNWLIDFCYDQIRHFNRTNLQILYNQDGDHAEILYDNGRIVRTDDPTGHNLECVKIGIFRLGNQNNTWWGSEQSSQRARCFGGQVEIDGKLSGYYLPVLNMQTNQAGLYDVISGKFLGNAGSSGPFVLPHDYELSFIPDPADPQNTIMQFTCRFCGQSYSVRNSPGASLPDGFQRLESISVSEPGAYIDTGFVPNQNTSIEIEFSSTSYADRDFFLFGAAGNAFNDRAFECYPWDNCFQLNYGDDYIFSVAPRANTRYLLSTDKAEYFITDVSANTLAASGVHANTVFSSPNSITLFALHRTNGISASSTGTIYSCIIKDGDAVVRSLIPARRTADHAIGMYDTVHNTFYENAGSGYFSAGSMIPSYEGRTLPDQYTALPYIRTTGTQYIDTGFRTETGMVAQYTASFSTSGYIVGSHSETAPYGRNGAYLNLARGFWELGLGESCPQNTSYERFSDKVYSVEFSTLSGDAYLKVDGNLLLESHEAQCTSPTPVYLFTSEYVLKRAQQGTACKLYSCRIYDSSRLLVRDFVPAKRAADGVAGLYDYVTGQFFESSGPDAFLDDTESKRIQDYTVLDKIVFDGDNQIFLPREMIGRFTVDAKSYDGKEVYPVYNNGYRLGVNSHPYFSKAYDFYEMTSYYEDTVLHHYIPVIHNSSLEIGVYDTVENAFYPSCSNYDAPFSQLFFLNSSEYHSETAELSATAASGLGQHFELMQKQGFELVSYYIETEESGGDIHRAPYSLVKRDYPKDGITYHLYWLNIPGTTGADEWTSNFTQGNQSSGFHEGFERGADFVLNGINSYIDRDPSHNKIIISGYSRGAAVASIVAAKLMDEGSRFGPSSVYAYGIACPNYSSRNRSYLNIFQICNAGDMVTALPLSEWGFGKEGVVMTLPSDSRSMNLLNSALLQYQKETEKDEVGYAGYTEDISSTLSRISLFVPESVARNPENSEKITHLFQALYEGGSMSALEIVQLLFQLRFDGSFSAAYSLVEFFISGRDKTFPSHETITYQNWIKIMDDQPEPSSPASMINVRRVDNKIFYSLSAECSLPATVICAQYVDGRQTELKLLTAKTGSFTMTARENCVYHVFLLDPNWQPMGSAHLCEND